MIERSVNVGTALAALMWMLSAPPARADCDWLPGDGLPGVIGYVTSMIVYDDGTGPALYVAGGFSIAGDVSVSNNIAKWDGAHWHPLGSGLDAGVYALAVYNSELIAGGYFTTAGGTPVNQIARWDGTSWRDLGGGVAGPAYATRVTAMTTYGGELVVGGGFTSAGGTPASNIAKWNGSSWSPLGSGIGGGSDPNVRAFTAYGPDLVVGGEFSLAGGQSANCIARWDGANWWPLGSGMSGGQYYSAVFGASVQDGELIAVGCFGQAGGVPAKNIAKWNGSNWEPLGSGLDANAFAIATYNGELVVGGYFDQAGGEYVSHIAKWNGTNWSSVGGGMAGFFSADTIVAELLVRNGVLVACGNFTRAGGMNAFSIAYWDGENWDSFHHEMNAPVRALSKHDDKLIAGGDFTDVRGSDAQHIAQWDGANWSGLGEGTNAAVCALANYDGDLIAGGFFTAAGGGSAAHIAKWDGTNWASLAEGVDDSVYALTIYNDELVAGGSFSTAGEIPASRVARWNGATWSPLGGGVTGSYGTSVGALGEYDGRLIVGGQFSNAGGVGANCIAQWDGVGWSPLGSGMSNGSSSASVRALAVFDSRLIAGGTFSGAGGGLVNGIAAWDGTSWSPLAGGVSGEVYALQPFEGALFVAGHFGYAGGVSVHNVARWDGETWTSLGGGIQTVARWSPFVQVLGTYEGYELLAGGLFQTAGDHFSTYIARWACDGACCLDGGSCQELVPSECRALGGVFQGAGVSCDEAQCCSLRGDVNGDGVVNGLDVPGFVRVKLGEPPLPGERLQCADYGSGTLEGDTLAFVADLLGA